MLITSGDERFGADDLGRLSELVSDVWLSAADADWSVPAGTLEWPCLATADHAVDCVYAPAFFLASRRLDRYPEAGSNLELRESASPEALVESLAIATRVLSSVVTLADEDEEAILFQRPQPITGRPPDFVPRAGVELILHAHDVCSGLGVSFEPPADLVHRLREHTRPWPLWDDLGTSADPWADLLAASGRSRTP